MSGETKLNEFIEAIEVWKSSKQLPPIRENDNINRLLELKSADIKKLTSEDRASGAYELYIYAEYLQQIKTKEKIILDWAESSIWYIIADRVSQYGDKYTKWQEKYYSAVKENPLASEVFKIKNHAEARVKTLDGTVDRVQRMAEILNNLSKRR
tara:strand:- start:65 stop:526 length:462 start_codon:yes stop_codon:yes gene_type:complete